MRGVAFLLSGGFGVFMAMMPLAGWPWWLDATAMVCGIYVIAAGVVDLAISR